MGTVHRARLTMLGLLVLTAAAATSAQVVLPYGGYGYGLGGYYGVPYPYAAPHVIKPVVKEIEVPVETLEFKAHDTGCTNVFGNAVPCPLTAPCRTATLGWATTTPTPPTLPPRWW